MGKRQFIIDGHTIHDDSDAFVIAEIGANHCGNIETCKQLFQAAKACGANAVKLQKRDNQSLFTKGMYHKPYASRHAFGESYGAHREALEFGWDEYVELKAYANDLGITFFATAFDLKSVEFLMKLDVPAFKTSSSDLKNIPLLKAVASTGKPIILSTGGGTMEDVLRAFEALTQNHQNFCLLQCTVGYPAKIDTLDLRVIETYRKVFPGQVIGLSSHDETTVTSVVAYALGARVIEKHFTLNRMWKGTDQSFSLEPKDLQQMVQDLKVARLSLGQSTKRLHAGENETLIKIGKKIVAAHPLRAGKILEPNDIAFKSPGDGLHPYYFEQVLGKRLKHNISQDENIQLDALQVE